jgi:tRNA(Ile)-lysidine synthase
LTVAHFNHGLRPEAATEEEAFVRKAAATLQVPIHVVTWGEKDRAQATGIQERARNWRRAECEKLVQEKQQGGEAATAAGQGVIATAHHADDSLETWVLKLLRGTHLSHIKGMESRAGLYIKPLLHVPKDRLIHFLKSQGLEWKEDGSNQVDKYKRNKVRLRLLPLMAEVAGGEAALKARMEEMTWQSKGLEEWLDGAANAWEERHTADAPFDIAKAGDELWIGVTENAASSSSFSSSSVSMWEPLPRLLKEELLHRFVARVTQGTISLPYGQVRRAMEQLERDEKEAEGGRKKKLQWRLEVGEGWVLGRQGDVLRVTKEESEGQRGEERESRVISMPAAGVTFLVPEGWALEAARLASSSSSAEKWDLILPHVPMGASLLLRHRQDGDRFHPAWRPGPIKLKDFLRGQNVPLHRRDEVLLVVLRPTNGEERVLGLHPTGHVAAALAGASEKVQPLGLRFEKG